MRSRLTGWSLCAGLAAVWAAAPAHAHPMDGFGYALTAAGTDTSWSPTPDAPAPARLGAVPEAACGPGGRPEQGLQGEVPRSDQAFAQEGYRCNVELVGEFPGDGAHIQLAWHGDCAYMSTLYATDDPEYAAKRGTVVLDVSDPRAPRETMRLQTPAMEVPHESLKVNERRGLLGAVEGGALPDPARAPWSQGKYFDLYDVSGDCRRPVLRSSVQLPNGSGHEGDFSPDGLTYYESTIQSAPLPAIIPVDISDPQRPKALTEWVSPLKTDYGIHGLQVTEDGNVGYFMAQGGPDNGLAIVDLSDIQSRRPNPQIRVTSRVAWVDNIVTQIGVPARIGGRPFIVANDEMGADRSNPANACQAGQPPFGFVRLVDISEPATPAVVSKIPLEVSDPANCATVLSEHAGVTTLSYSSHYCSVDDPANTTAVACTWFGSGLRVFDVRDPLAPREIAYYNPAPNAAATRGNLLKPFVIPRAEQDVAGSNVRWKRGSDGTWMLWFMSMQNGLQVVRLTNGIYPLLARAPGATPHCSSSAAPRSRLVRGGLRISRAGVRLRGVAGARACAARVDRVLVSIARVGRARRCQHLRPSGRLGPARLCSRAAFLPAHGAERFSLGLKARLPRGRYRVGVRAIDSAGNRERVHFRRARVR